MPSLSQSLVSECGMILHSICLLDSFLHVGHVCLVAGPGCTSSGCVFWLDVSWLGGSWLRLPDTGAREA